MSSPGTIRFKELTTSPAAPPPGYGSIYMKTDNVFYIKDSSGVETPIGTSFGITGLTGDASATGPGIATLTINYVGGQSAANVAAAVVAVQQATSANTPLKIVQRDSSGDIHARIVYADVTGNLNGNAATATQAISTIDFTGSLDGDVSGGQDSTVVDSVGGSTAAQIHSAELLANAATSANAASQIVKRGPSGQIIVGFIASADTTQSTDKDSGAIVTEGGIGAEKNISSGGNINAVGTVTGSNLSGNNTGDTSLTAVGSAPNVNGATLTGQAITLQPADGTRPGVLTALAQTLGGIKTFLSQLLVSDTTQSTDKDSGSIITQGGLGVEKNINAGGDISATGNLSAAGTVSASNFTGSSSGANTGDVTTTAVGSAPNANGSSISGQALTLQPANSTLPGVLSAISQSIGGVKTFIAQLLVSDTTQSVDKDSGSIVTEGGLGVEKNINAGGNIQALGTVTGSNISGTTSGTNTGDTSFGAVGSAPNSNGASLSGQVITLEPADGTRPGLLTAISQTIGGVKSFLAQLVVSDVTQSVDPTTGSIVAHGGIGAAKNINAGGNIASDGNISATGSMSAANFSGSSSGAQSGTNTNDVSASPVGVVPNANGFTLTGQVLNLQPADSTNPGALSVFAQAIAGIKTFLSQLIVSDVTQSGDPTTGSITTAGGIGAAKNINAGGNITAVGTVAGSNVSGTTSGSNTGDATLSAVGSVPNANGASFSGQVLTLEPANGTNPGLLSAIAQTIGGSKTLLAPLLVTDTAQSIDKDTGSIVTDGGIGVEKNINAGGSITAVGTVLGSNVSGTNTGDEAVLDTNSIDLTLSSHVISADLRISSDAADIGNIKATSSIHTGASPGLHVEIPVATPVQVGTSNNVGASSSAARADHVHDHGIQSIGALHAAVTSTVNGFMAFADKVKLDAATALATVSTLVFRDSNGDTAVRDISYRNGLISNRSEFTQTTTPTAPAATKLNMYTTVGNGFSILRTQDETGFITALSRDTVFRAQNNSGATILKGQPVYPSGSDISSSLATIAPARSNSSSTMPILGIAAENIADGTIGRVMVFGILGGVDTSAFSAGSTIYVSETTAGTLTSVRPSAPNLWQRVGNVITSNATTGIIEVRPGALHGEEQGSNTGFTLNTVALTDAANIALDASLGNCFTVTLAGNRTLSAPTNPKDGQKITLRVRQDATGSRTLSFDAIFRFGQDSVFNASPGANKTDYIGMIYNAADSKWDVVAIAKGF